MDVDRDLFGRISSRWLGKSWLLLAAIVVVVVVVLLYRGHLSRRHLMPAAISARNRSRSQTRKLWFYIERFSSSELRGAEDIYIRKMSHFYQAYISSYTAFHSAPRQ